MNGRPLIPSGQFYGRSQANSELKSGDNLKTKKTVIPYVPRNLLFGPNILWKVFPKQDEALEYMKLCKDGLMCFAFEHFGPGRLFLVAHPEVFWHYDSQRELEARCTYEIITEFTACKIYVDLEYDRTLNESHKGDEMVNVFINLLCFHLKEIWGLICCRKNVLDLDSSTKSKFSRHLIFNTPFCFSNNYHVGSFMKHVCHIVKEVVDNGVLPEKMASHFTINEIKSLMVIDGKGNLKIFCDEGVYTKNRHFRLYKSTKKGKHSNLELSSENQFICDSELQYFFHSLITHISEAEIKVLELATTSFVGGKKVFKDRLEHIERDPSPYPFIDKFMSDLILPGQIYRNIYFAAKKIILYDIVGNRYCGNIGRQHKRNNVKYVVDLKEYVYYQKCYDVDCSGYKSEKVSLPGDIIFKVSDSSDICVIDKTNHGVFGLSPSDTEQVMEAIEAVVTNCSESDPLPEKTFKKFPSFGLSDEELIGITYEY